MTTFLLNITEVGTGTEADIKESGIRIAPNTDFDLTHRILQVVKDSYTTIKSYINSDVLRFCKDETDLYTKNGSLQLLEALNDLVTKPERVYSGGTTLPEHPEKYQQFHYENEGTFKLVIYDGTTWRDCLGVAI